VSYIPDPRRRTKPDFSLTIVNIVFLLLLFYLATGAIVSQSEIEADVPVTVDLPLESLPRPLLLIAADGLFLDGRAVSRGDLTAAIRTALESRPEAAFLNVLAERSMPATKFLDIVAEAGRAGVPIRIVTLRHRPPSQAAVP